MLLILIYSQVHKDYFKLCGENIVEFQGFYIIKKKFLFFFKHAHKISFREKCVTKF